MAKGIAPPAPPKELIAIEEVQPYSRILVANEVRDWAFQTFIDEDSSLINPEHEHLRFANIGCLWSDAPNKRNGLAIIGTAELCKPPNSLNKWAKVGWEQQHREWFGEIPDFKITIYAPYAAAVDDVSFCALIEHELLHCAQAMDEFGFPKFTKQGMPKFAIRGHDAEEFVSIVRRYGARAGAGRTFELIKAAKYKPKVGLAKIAGAC